MSTDSPIPQSLPRQKAYIYILLIGLTGFLIYCYSYPLDARNWAHIKQKIVSSNSDNDRYPFVVSDTSGYHSATGDDNRKSAVSVILQKIFLNVSGDSRAKERQQKSTGATSEGERTSPVIKRQVTKTGTVRNDGGQENGVPSPIITRYKEKKTKTTEAWENIKTIVDVAKKRLPKTTLGEIRTEETTKKPEEIIDASKVVTAMVTTCTSDCTTSPPINKDVGTLNTARQTGFKRTSVYTNKNKGTLEEISTSTIVTKRPILRGISVTESVVSSSASAKENTTLGKGYLVFSEQCRIPDLDPMHPSIAHLITKTPPLDCSENHTPLTRTEGHVLFLNQTAALERTAGGSYTCCYRSVFREKEGQSDDGVGFSKECTHIFKEMTIKDEFIAVECKHQNGTVFYREFHSFIFNKPEVEKRCGNSTDSQYSVLIIGVDAVSRLNMHRQLNATAEYLLKEMDAVEMYGFNKVGDNTFPNLIPLLVGYDERELPSVCWKSNYLPLDRCNFLWKRFAKRGYRTLYAEDSPRISTFNYVKAGFYLQPTDYYFRPFILAYEEALSRDKPLNCYLCVGSTSETEAVLHWTEQFASHFTKRPYFAFSWINSATHDFLNTGSSVDHMYEIFFRTLHQTGALDKTVVILMGDHGMRWGEIRHTYIGRLEERLPMLIISLPKLFKRDHPEFAKVLQQNSRRLVTPFDLHATLVHLLDLKEGWSITNPDNVADELSRNFTRRALSLFQLIPENRSCDDAFIEEHWCTCESSLEVDVQNDDVKRVAKFLLSRINILLRPVSDKCALLKLDSITDARLWQPPAVHKGHSADDNIYTAVIQTSPGKAVFEGTVKITELKTGSELLGTISRLNLYGNQSACINDAMLKKYCYCL